MTWNKADGGHRGASPGMRAKVERALVAPVPEQMNLEDTDNLPSVFAAMQVGENGQGIFGESSERFPGEMEMSLIREHGWYPERTWDVIRKWMTRDTEAV